MICKVVVDIKTNKVNQFYEYIIPKNLIDVVEIGHRVYVSFHNRKVVGFVFDITNTPSGNYKLKEIIDVMDFTPILNKELIEIAKYMAKNYFTFFITILELMIPPALKVKYEKNLVLLDKDKLPNTLLNLFKDKEEVPLKNVDNLLNDIKKAINNNAVELVDVLSQKARKKYIKMVKLLNKDVENKSQKGKELINYLSTLNDDIPKDTLLEEFNYTSSVLNTLVKNEAITIYDKEVYRKVSLDKYINIKDITLNEEQKNVINEINRNLLNHKTHLIHGVTGSGKTEVYLNIIKEIINNDKEAIMLVPEISLTPQMVDAAKSKFGDMVAIIHSRLSVNERYDEWRKIYNKEVKIAVGARSAIFAPFTNLGVIIIDEMHDSSYKQDTDPKYDTLEIAKLRSKYNNCNLILGSATPNVKYYYDALNNDINLLNITKRANQKELPRTHIIDMRQEIINNNKSIFSKRLYKAINNTFQDNKQSILFLNKRGHSTYVMCRECGTSIDCNRCDVSLTYHKENNKLRCHYCDYEQDNTNKCPSCNSRYIKFVGGGTQKLEEEINKILPEAKTLRIDTDTITKKHSTEIMFDKFRNHEYDILIGTQMIAKGLDFPKVTLVGIVNADIGLKIPVYDASESTFNVIMQASGRAGRDKDMGEVYIQTYNPKHYAIVHASKHDYLSFYKEELEYRRNSKNPPFKKLIEIIVSSSDLFLCRSESNIICNMLKRLNNVDILGPARHSIFKVNQSYRYVIMVKFDNIDLSILSNIKQMYEDKKNIFIKIARM